MPAYNCRRSLNDLAESCLDAALRITKLKQGTRRHDLDEALHVVTGELFSWGLEDLKTFLSASVLAQAFCREILEWRNDEEMWLRCGLTSNDVYKTLHEEYENLLKILSRKDADLDKAYAFCLLLNRVGLAQCSFGRRGLAA